MNNVNLLGRFGQDPELRYFESGSCRVSFWLAVDDTVKRDGQWVKQPVWIKCEAWGKLASDVIAQYCRKGSQVAVSGKLKVENWQDKATGANRSKTLVNVQKLHMTDSKQDNGQPRPPAPQSQPAYSNQQAADRAGGSAPDYNEVPF